MGNLILAPPGQAMVGGDRLTPRGVQQAAWLGEELSSVAITAAFCAPGAAEQTALQVKACQVAMGKAALSELQDRSKFITPNSLWRAEPKVRAIHNRFISPRLNNGESVLVVAPRIPFLAYAKLVEGRLDDEILQNVDTPQIRSYAVEGRDVSRRPGIVYPLRRI